MLLAFNRFGRATRQMRAHQLLRTMVGIGGQNGVNRGVHLGDGGIGKTPGRNHIALGAVEFDFSGGQAGRFAGGHDDILLSDVVG